MEERTKRLVLDAIDMDASVTEGEKQAIRRAMAGTQKAVMLTAKAVCEQLGITRRTLSNWEKAGTINGIRMSSRKIRFNQADVTRLLTQGAFTKEKL
jgi:excisionase family DNA binding protein